MQSQVSDGLISQRIEEGLMYTWGDARKQPYGLPNHHAVSATEVKILSDAGTVYK